MSVFETVLTGDRWRRRAGLCICVRVCAYTPAVTPAGVCLLSGCSLRVSATVGPLHAGASGAPVCHLQTLNDTDNVG